MKKKQKDELYIQRGNAMIDTEIGLKKFERCVDVEIKRIKKLLMRDALKERDSRIKEIKDMFEPKFQALFREMEKDVQ